MNLSELMDVYLSDIGLFREFISLMVCTSCVATLMFVYLFRGIFGSLEKMIIKIKRHFYLKRHQEAIWHAIRSVYLVSQLYEKDVLIKEGITNAQANLIEDALNYYARKKYIEKKKLGIK